MNDSLKHFDSNPLPGGNYDVSNHSIYHTVDQTNNTIAAQSYVMSFHIHVIIVDCHMIGLACFHMLSSPTDVLPNRSAKSDV